MLIVIGQDCKSPTSTILYIFCLIFRKTLNSCGLWKILPTFCLPLKITHKKNQVNLAFSLLSHALLLKRPEASQINVTRQSQSDWVCALFGQPSNLWDWDSALFWHPRHWWGFI